MVTLYIDAMPYKDPAQARAAWRRYYARTPEQRVKTRARIMAARERNRIFIDELKAGPCTDCGDTFPGPAMDFDHRQDKMGGIAKMVRDGLSLDRLKREIAKCDLVCSNCHRVRTATRDGWYHHVGTPTLESRARL